MRDDEGSGTTEEREEDRSKNQKKRVEKTGKTVDWTQHRPVRRY